MKAWRIASWVRRRLISGIRFANVCPAGTVLPVIIRDVILEGVGFVVRSRVGVRIELDGRAVGPAADHLGGQLIANYGRVGSRDARLGLVAETGNVLRETTKDSE